MQRNKITPIHVSFWTLFVLVGVLINVAAHHEENLTWELYMKDLFHPFTLIGYGRTILMCYVSLWAFEALFLRKRYFLAVLSIILLIVTDVAFRYLIEQLFIGPVFGLWQFHKGIGLHEYFVETVFFSMLGIFLCFFLKIINDFFKNETIKRERIDMELQFLKSQINPHFLFNTFNNLYGLSLSEPQKTPEAIVKLSNMMRYMLYESNENEVLLTKEIANLRNMIELQKMRYEGDTFIDFMVSGNIVGKTIAPCLLISFVENAFKHGEMQDDRAPLTINLLLQRQELYFQLKK